MFSWNFSNTWFKEICPACKAAIAAWILLAISVSDCFLGDGLMTSSRPLVSKSKGDLRLNRFGSSQEGSLREDDGGLWGEKRLSSGSFCLIWTGGDFRRRLASTTTSSESLLPSLLEAFSASSILESLIFLLPSWLSLTSFKKLKKVRFKNFQNIWHNLNIIAVLYKIQIHQNSCILPCCISKIFYKTN